MLNLKRGYGTGREEARDIPRVEKDRGGGGEGVAEMPCFR